VISLVSIGVFLLCELATGAAIIPARVQEMSARASALTTAMQTQPSDPIGAATPRQELDGIAVSNTAKAPDAAKEMSAPDAVADIATTAAIPNVEMRNARYYRQQGSLAYRGKDLALALIDFDLAIDLDPNLSDAYINRAIVLHRMGDLKRALADVAQAKRVDELGHSQALALKPRKPRLSANPP
jgi:tetratricopeptide (TPR) repeat protein